MCTGPAGCGASQCTTLQEDWVLAYVMLPAGGQQRVSMRKEASSQSGHFASLPVGREGYASPEEMRSNGPREAVVSARLGGRSGRSP